MYKQVCITQMEDDNTCIKVYDPEEQRLIAVYKQYTHAANKLGLSTSLVQHAAMRKARSYCERYGKHIAIRLSSLKEGDLDRIEYCRKFGFLPKETKTLKQPS